jgi:hypothetical protein
MRESRPRAQQPVLQCLDRHFRKISEKHWRSTVAALSLRGRPSTHETQHLWRVFKVHDRSWMTLDMGSTPDKPIVGGVLESYGSFLMPKEYHTDNRLITLRILFGHILRADKWNRLIVSNMVAVFGSCSTQVRTGSYGRNLSDVRSLRASIQGLYLYSYLTQVAVATAIRE